MVDIKEYVRLFQNQGVDIAEKYRLANIPDHIYKFIPLYDRGNASVNKRNIETLSENKVWASKYFSLNDPYEFNAMYLDKEKLLKAGDMLEVYQGYWKYIAESFLTVSFCAENEIHPLNNMPMWAYYANNHHGICVEYKVNKPYCIYPVSYETERNPMTAVLGNFVSLSLDAVKGKIPGNDPELMKYQFLILNLMCIKHRSWKQENEYRVLYPYPRLEEDGKRIALAEMGLEMSAVFVGKDCSSRNTNKLKDLAKNTGITSYKMKVNSEGQNFDMTYEVI